MIKNLILDVGEVLLGFQFIDVIKSYGVSEDEAKRIGMMILRDSFWSSFDRGNITEEELLMHFKNTCPKDYPVIKYFLENSGKLPKPRPRVYCKVEKLIDLGLKVYILSNYPERLFIEHSAHIPFLDRLSGLVVSYQVHLCKPEPEIYEYLLSRYNLKACECIFLDDNIANINAAKDLDINAKLITSEECLLEELDKIQKYLLS